MCCVTVVCDSGSELIVAPNQTPDYDSDSDSESSSSGSSTSSSSSGLSSSGNSSSTESLGGVGDVEYDWMAWSESDFGSEFESSQSDGSGSGSGSGSAKGSGNRTRSSRRGIGNGDRDRDHDRGDMLEDDNGHSDRGERWGEEAEDGVEERKGDSSDHVDADGDVDNNNDIDDDNDEGHKGGGHGAPIARELLADDDDDDDDDMDGQLRDMGKSRRRTSTRRRGRGGSGSGSGGSGSSERELMLHEQEAAAHGTVASSSDGDGGAPQVKRGASYSTKGSSSVLGTGSASGGGGGGASSGMSLRRDTDDMEYDGVDRLHVYYDHRGGHDGDMDGMVADDEADSGERHAEAVLDFSEGVREVVRDINADGDNDGGDCMLVDGTVTSLLDVEVAESVNAHVEDSVLSQLDVASERGSVSGYVADAVAGDVVVVVHSDGDRSGDDDGREKAGSDADSNGGAGAGVVVGGGDDGSGDVVLDVHATPVGGAGEPLPRRTVSFQDMRSRVGVGAVGPAVVDVAVPPTGVAQLARARASHVQRYSKRIVRDTPNRRRRAIEDGACQLLSPLLDRTDGVVPGAGVEPGVLMCSCASCGAGHRGGGSFPVVPPPCSHTAAAL